MEDRIKHNIDFPEKVKDYLVSEEEFTLSYDEEHQMLHTSPQPDPDKLSDYYESQDYISHTSNKRNLMERGYHFARVISLKRKVKIINSCSAETKKLLDVGCGTGDFLHQAQAGGWDVTGIEPNEKAREIANEKTKNSIFDVDELKKFDPQSFDVITLWHVLEHLVDLEDQIQTLKTLLKPNGTLIIAVPNFRSYDAIHYKEFWAAFDVPRHLWHFSQHSIKSLFAKVKMTVTDIKPLKFDAYYVSLLSEKYKSGSMKPHKAFWVAWRSNNKARRSTEYSSLIYIIKND